MSEIEVFPIIPENHACESSYKISTSSDQGDNKVEEIAARYLKLCAEFQSYYKKGYVPESFYEMHIEFTLAEAQLDTKVRDAYNRLVSEARVAEYLNQSNPVEACDKRVDVPGNGDCGLHALGVGLIDQRKPEAISKLIEETQKLPQDADTSIVALQLSHLNTQEDSQRLLNDSQFMHALARVLRKIGHTQVPNHLRNIYPVLSPNDEQMIQELIPAKDNVWVEAEGLIALSNILKMRICIDVRGQNEERLYIGAETKHPDFVIRHSCGHFTPYLR